MCTSCKDCKKRKLHCHSTCKDYLEFVKDNEKRKALEEKNKDLHPVWGARSYSHYTVMHKLRGVEY